MVVVWGGESDRVMVVAVEVVVVRGSGSWWWGDSGGVGVGVVVYIAEWNLTMYIHLRQYHHNQFINSSTAAEKISSSVSV